jgi:glucose/arabinose dehydrogenase
MMGLVLSISLVVLPLTTPPSAAEAAGFSLRFHGSGAAAPDQDRVKIPIDNPARPADIGAGDFTLEFWMKALPGENGGGTCFPGHNNWITGHIIFDRDVNGPGDFGDYGISLFSTGLAFGVASGVNGNGICGATDVADGVWHHIAVTRNAPTGQLRLFVDGMLDAEGAGPTGDVSYRDNRSGPAPNDPFLVIGAEKHDAGAQHPSYSGWIDEVRLSNTIRYTQSFTRPTQPFSADPNTVALYHFDEGSGNAVTDSSGAPGGPSDGTRHFGGSPAGPEWSPDTPPFGGPIPITLEEAAIGLVLPVAITDAGDGSGRLFITLQGGRILIYDGRLASPFPFLDIRSRVRCCGGEGMLSTAFHPNYPAMPYFFVYYTETEGNIIIARYTVSADPNVADHTSGVEILRIPQTVSTGNLTRNGGQLQFGPDGYLYIGTGDGGDDSSPSDVAQNLSDLHGKILRIDVDSGSPYAIPADNPFVEHPIDDPNTRGEIWARGLRNPWRFSFDRQRGDLFIGDVGEGRLEEVNFQRAGSAGGQNYGWPRMEGSACFEPSVGCNDGTLTLPILEYDHSAGKCSVTGGYRYRGSRLPQLYGTYLYGDFCSGRIWGATPNGLGGWATTELVTAPFFITSFGEDQSGNLYVTDYTNSRLYRITAAPRPYGATYSPASPPSLTAGQTTIVPVTVTNTGTITWGANNTFRLAYHWYNEGGFVIWDGFRTVLSQAVGPGQGIALQAILQAPSTPGTYTLKWDMVDEGVTWFSAQGVPMAEQTVVVTHVGSRYCWNRPEEVCQQGGRR